MSITFSSNKNRNNITVNTPLMEVLQIKSIIQNLVNILMDELIFTCLKFNNKYSFLQQHNYVNTLAQSRNSVFK